MDLREILLGLNQTFTLFIVFPTLLFLGLYLSLRLRFVQLSKLKMSFSCLINKREGDQGHISHFEAISAVLAGNFGTGNISGMAVAVATGGPGALVWMWVMAFFGAAIQYASCLLSVKYRIKNGEGEYVGGPMYYLRDGLHFRKLSIAFAVFTLFAAITVGNFTQINSVTLPLIQLGFNPFWSGLVIAFFVGMVILGGIQRLAKFASIIVPIKALLYLGSAFFILIIHHTKVVPAFQLMFYSAFDFSSLAGGIFGYTVLRAISTGFERGIFATDAGTGIVPILQASARTSNPVIDGIATLVAPFLVMIVCTSTGLVLLVTGAWQSDTLQSTNMVTQAFETGLGSQYGAWIVIVSLVLFAYTTILAWAYCGEKALGFLTGAKYARLFRYAYIALIPIGTMMQVDVVWAMADIAISLMLMTNMIGIIGLSRSVIEDSRSFALVS